MPAEVRFSGAVLAGGRSKRFGSDKARYVLDGKPLLTRVLDSLSAASERFVVADKKYDDFGVPVYQDTFAVQTPLSGVHTALSRAREEWVAVAACDLPYLTPDYWAALAQFCPGERAVIVCRAGRLEPLAALYHRDLAHIAAARLSRGDLAVHMFAKEVEARILDWDTLANTLALPPAVLTNLNSLQDLPRPL